MATKVSFGFARLSDTDLDNLAQGVIDETVTDINRRPSN